MGAWIWRSFERGDGVRPKPDDNKRHFKTESVVEAKLVRLVRRGAEARSEITPSFGLRGWGATQTRG